MASKSDLYDFMPLLLLTVWMTATKYFPPEYQEIMGWIGFPLIFAAMYMLEIWYEHVTGSKLFFDALLIPENKKFRFYVEKMDTKGLGDGYFSTKCKLAWAKTHPYYKKIHELTINHRGEREKRILFQPGRAIFKGNWISHPQTTFAILGQSGSGIERGVPKPVVDLVWGTGDAYKQKVDLKDPAIAKLFTKSSNPGKLTFDNKEALRIITKQKQEILKLKSLFMQDHNARLLTEETSDLQKEETSMALAIPGRFRAALVRHMLSYVEAHGRIEDALKHLQRGGVKTWPRNLGVIVGIVAVVGYFTAYPDKFDMIYKTGSSWLSIPSNQIFAIAALVAIVGGFIVWKRRK